MQEWRGENHGQTTITSLSPSTRTQARSHLGCRNNFLVRSLDAAVADVVHHSVIEEDGVLRACLNRV